MPINFRGNTAARSRLCWNTNTDWNLGTVPATLEVSGSGDAAVLRLKAITNNDDDIPYTTAGNYTPSDGAKVEIASGLARLKAITGSTADLPFTTSGNYTFDSGKIIVAGGVAKLVGSDGLVDNLEAYYKMNEASWNGTSGEVTDSSLNTNDGTAVGNATTIAGGKIGRAGTFDGTGDSVSIPHDASLSFETTDPFSFACWAKIPSGGNRSLMSKQQVSGSVGINCQVLTAGTIRMNLIGSTGSLAVDSTNTVDNDAYHHIVITYDGSETAAGLKTYIDGSLETPVVVVDSLSGTIITAVDFRLGNREADDQDYDGDLDEAGVWSKELTSGQVTSLYNSGSGLELDFYPTDNPSIINNTGIAFGAVFTAFTETATKPGSDEIKYHISADDGVTWDYWTGAAWAVTDDTYAQANTASEIDANISTWDGSGTLKVRSLLHSDDSSTTPELDNINVEIGVTYSTDDNLYVDTKDAAQISPSNVIAWLTTTISSTLPGSTDSKLLFSVDGRVSWLTWGGSSWDAPASATARANATSFSDAVTNFASLPVGSKTLDVRLFLFTSDNLVRPIVTNINIISDAGFEFSGVYVTNQVNSGEINNPWDIVSFLNTLGSGGTVVIKTKAANSTAELTAASYGAALSNGDDAGVTGQYIQFEITITGDGTETTSTDRLCVDYENLARDIVSP